MYGASEIQEFLVKKGAGISEALNFFPRSPITQYISTVDKIVSLQLLSPDDITNLNTLYHDPDHDILLKRFCARLKDKVNGLNYSDYLSKLELNYKDTIPEIYKEIRGKFCQEYYNSYIIDNICAGTSFKALTDLLNSNYVEADKFFKQFETKLKKDGITNFDKINKSIKSYESTLPSYLTS